MRRGVDLPGAAHAAEHTSIGLLPLFAACDRWDIGGVSADLHPATGRLTVFVYDGHEGGAGFAERGFAVARDWLAATRQAIADCECAGGLPVLHPVTQVRQRQRAAEQGRCAAAAGPAAGTAARRTARHEATPAGGESGGRRAAPDPGAVIQSLCHYPTKPTVPAHISYQPVTRGWHRLRLFGPMLPDRGQSRREHNPPHRGLLRSRQDHHLEVEHPRLRASFYRNGLISRSDVVRGALAQLAFRLGGASHQRMEKIRDQVSQGAGAGRPTGSPRSSPGTCTT